MLTSLLSAFGLSTAAGLNAYIPLLVIGLLGRYTDLVALSGPYDLLTHPAVLVTLGVLGALDFVGDKVPAVDHVLHVIGVVLHPVAGAVAFMAANSSTGTVDPVLAAICGLILAGGTHGARASIRPLATATTGGIANPVLSLLEDAVSLVLAVLAVLLPVLAFGLVVLLALLVALAARRLLQRRRAPDLAR